MTDNKLSKQDIKIKQGYFHMQCKIDKVYLNDKYIGVNFGYFLTEKELCVVYQNVRILFWSFQTLRNILLRIPEDERDNDQQDVLDSLNKCYDEIYHDGRTEADYYEELLNKAVRDILSEDDK